MPEQKDNSSLPLLLGISATIVLSVGGGWFLLERNEAARVDTGNTAASLPQVTLEAEHSRQPEAATDLETLLRRARLAADADLLAYPARQSALHYYGRALAAEPANAVARAEFDAVLNRIAQQVSGHLVAKEFERASELANLVAQQEPGHALVDEARQALDDHAGELVEQAMRQARSGNFKDARTALATAASLPGRDPEYFSTLRAAIDEAQESRAAAAREKRQLDRQSAARTAAAWLDRFHGAISSGRLISPAGDSARDYLVADDAPAEGKEQLTDELVAALVTSFQANLGSNQLQAAESMLTAVAELADDHARLTELQSALENAYIQAEQAKVRTMRDLVRVKSASPRYPMRAKERGVNGWVEVLFTVTPTGETTDIEVAQAEPESIFDASAKAAVARWTFQPLEFRGQIISQRAGVRLTYRLE